VWKTRRSEKAPPKEQRVATLEMLNMMSLFPMSEYEPRGVDELHTRSAEGWLYADLRWYFAVPRFQQSGGGGSAFYGLRARAS
jgi:hypothetical protein